MQSTRAKAPIGILMLDTNFPRFLGDIGNRASFDFPVLYKTVTAASPELAVLHDPKPMLDAFIEAGQDLIKEGVKGISTSCGFLSLFQDELSEALAVPVLTSALIDVARVQAALPDGQKVGILTISASSLSARHLRAASVPDGTPIGSTECGGEFTKAILSNRNTLDMELARQDNVNAAISLVQTEQKIGALMLECTNMGPYAGDIAKATGLPVHSIVTVLTRFQKDL
ncbi:MAG: aspartate/glutamate racemase family protein [Pseudomonadota bacterium]